MPAKTLKWVATGDAADFGTAANWLDIATSGTPSSLDNGDTFILDAGNTNVNPANTGLSSCTLIVTSDYKGTIAPGGVLQIDLASLQYKGYGANLGCAVSGSASIEAQGEAKVNLMPTAAKTVADLFAGNTNLDIGTNCAVTEYRQDGGLVNAAAGTAFTKCAVDGGGQLNTKRDGPFCVGPKSVVNVEGTAKPATGGMVEPYGELHIKSSTDFPDPCVTEVRPRGLLHASGSSRGMNMRTVNRWPRSKVNPQTQSNRATITEAWKGTETEAGSPVQI